MDAPATTRSYRDLVVWQKAIAFVKQIYLLTRCYPADERFGLVSQMRRAAVSIPSNIAEGQARRTTGEFIHALSHAEGSAAELDTQLILSVELGFATQEEANRLTPALKEIQRMLNALCRRLSAT